MRREPGPGVFLCSTVRLAGRALAALFAVGLLGVMAACGTSAVPSAATAALSATTLSFAAATVGTSGGLSTVTLANTGGQALSIAGMHLSDPSDYAVSSTCGDSLAAGVSCAISVQFRPQTAASLPATLMLTDNSGGQSGAEQIISLSGTGTAVPVAQAVLAPVSLHFGSAVLQTSAAAQTVTLSNPGTVALAISGAVLSDPSDFDLTATTCGSTLAASASCTISIAFRPETVGPVSATLAVTDDAGGGSGAQQSVALSGTGIPIPMAQVGLSPMTLVFAATVMGTTAPVQNVTLSNTGSASLSIGGITVGDAADYSVSSACGTTLAAGATCTLAVSFHPGTTGLLGSTLTLTDNAGVASGTVQQGIALQGTGLPVPLAQVAVAPGSLSFAATVLGTTAAAQTVVLSNTGTAVLAINGIAVGDTADFGVSSECGATLAVGASCALAVSFHPVTTGVLASTLTVTDNSGMLNGAVQQDVPLRGTGLPVPVPQAVLAPASAAFGSVNVGSASAAQSFTLTNTGTAALTMGGVSVSDAADFSVTNNCGASLAAGASCGLSVVFDPQKAGSMSATLMVSDNSGGVSGAQQTIAVSGTGVAPAPQAVLSAAALSFPDTMMTLRSAAETVVLTNAGNAPLVLSGVSLSETQDFSLSSSCTGTLAAGASCALTVVFQPQAVAAFGAVLTVADNSGTSGALAQQTVALGGNGIAFALPRAAASPESVAFAKTMEHQSAAPQSVMLTNTGTTALTVTGVTLTGTNASAFQVSGGSCGGMLAAGASCSETVVYSPVLGSYGDSAALVFTDDSLGIAGSTQTVGLTGVALAEVDSVENFGDSITCGFYAMPNDGTGLVWSMEGYAGLFDAWLGVPAQNWCRQGDTAADLSRLWVPFHSAPTVNGNQMFTLMIGANDAYRYGIPQDALTTYTATVGAALAWLAMPNSDKVLANAVTQESGTWSPDVGFGMMSSDAGASLTFNVNQAVAGRNLYVVYHVWAEAPGVAGEASIAVDGTVQATVDESLNSRVRVPTENGTTDTFVMQTVPLGGVGPHTVTFQSVGPSGSTVGLLWAGVPQQDYHVVDGAPRVLVGLVTDSYSGNQTFAADNYNWQLESLIPALNNDGMNLVLVPTDRVLDLGTDFADILHPDTAGHAKLAAVFEQYR